MRQREELEWVGVRHEEVAAFAAGAEAHLTGKLAVCAGSCGPGNLHLINGLYDCHRSRVPVLAIAAQIPSSELGTGYFQETRPDILFKECSHYCEPIAQAQQAPRVLEIALRSALGKGGVSVITLPGDVAQAKLPEAAPLRFEPPQPAVRPSPGELNELAALLNAGRKVTILAGAGCAGAHEELVQTALALQAPIVHALRGKEYVEYDNPFDVGMTGLLGFASGYYAMMDCDVLLMLGTDFPYPQFFPEKARVAQVDLRAESLGRRARLALGCVGDVRETLRALLPAHIHHALMDVLARNGVQLRNTYQIVSGGNMDSLNLQDAARVQSKKEAKVQGFGGADLDPQNVLKAPPRPLRESVAHAELELLPSLPHQG